MQNYRDFFKAATGIEQGPHDYQCRLACGERRPDEPEADWLSHGVACHSRLIDIPTGLGKTAAVVLAWLWNRVAGPSAISIPKSEIASTTVDPWPRRLVYCLPMRTLVEQTSANVEMWLWNLLREDPGNQGLRWLCGFAGDDPIPDQKAPPTDRMHSPVILMGGEDLDSGKKDWDVYPEKPAILIGTQDMLLSRALNRGYGMSRYRWPMHFALLNIDCLWVTDETQLMGVGVETSAQLDGFRQSAHKKPESPCPTWWMSATLEEARLTTVDHPTPADGWPKLELNSTERLTDGVRERFEAKKSVQMAGFTLSSATKDAHAKELSQLIKDRHVGGTLTLVVVNRVNRARKLYAALRDKKSGLNPERIALIHSRFRPVDRDRHTQLLFGEGDRIVIATQAVEAGVDVSARLLITELAPWSSLVQRIGRCNRKGDMANAELFWVDLQPKDDRDDLLLPYALEDLKKARSAIQDLNDAGPKSLSPFRVEATPVIRPVIRRRDLLDLFDTTPDLCGQDLDISRYIRDGEDSDVQFFWREIAAKADPANEPRPERHELCRVPISEAAKFLKKNRDRAWQWDALDEVWQKAEHARPGGVYLVATDAGGYDDDLGWTGDAKSRPIPHSPATTESGNDAYAKDPRTFARYWLEYDDHVQGVVTTMGTLAQSLALDDSWIDILRTAARWHDTGKTHACFQKMLIGDDPGHIGRLWAKSANKNGRPDRHGFRHELASALTWLAAGPTDAPERDLIAYLIAAHHGKVRLSLRALPDEKGDPSSPDRLFARGIWDRDVIGIIPGLTEAAVTLDLSLMQMGAGPLGPSWLARTIALRDRFGPFHLAYLETLLRAADMRTSAAEAAQHAPHP